MFGQHAGDFSVTLDELPGALHSAQRGLTRLNTTLDILDDTADDIRPEAEELDHTLGHIDPILCRAVPVVHQLEGRAARRSSGAQAPGSRRCRNSTTC